MKVTCVWKVAKIEEMRKIGKKNRKGRETVWLRFASIGEKLDVMKGKKLLRDRNEWITDDLIERKRKIKWRLKRRRRIEGEQKD